MAHAAAGFNYLEELDLHWNQFTGVGLRWEEEHERAPRFGTCVGQSGGLHVRGTSSNANSTSSSTLPPSVELELEPTTMTRDAFHLELELPPLQHAFHGELKLQLKVESSSLAKSVRIRWLEFKLKPVTLSRFFV